MLALMLLLAGSPTVEVDNAAGHLLRQELISLLEHNKAIDVKLPGFTGTIAPVDPGKSLIVKATGVSLTSDTVTLKLSISGEWLLKGKVALGEKPTDVTVKVKATVTADASATIVHERKNFRAVPLVKDVELSRLEVIDLTPEPFAGAKILLPGVVTALWKTRKSEVLKTIRAAISAIELPRPTVSMVATGPGDNKVLRQYAQSMIASQLVHFDNEKTGLSFEEKLPSVEANGAVWLHEPARRLKVSVAHLDVKAGILNIAGEIEVPVRGACSFTAAEVVEGNTDFSATVRVRFGGDLECKDCKPGGCNVYLLAPSLSDFEAGAAPFRVVKRAVEGLANRLIEARATSFRNSIEKLGGGPNRTRLVDVAYRAVLGRAPEKEGLRGWSAFLDRQSPRRFLVSLAASVEAAGRLKGKNEEEVVKAIWPVFLRRDPSREETKAWVAFLRESVPVQEERRVRVGRLRFERRMVEVGRRKRNAGDLATALAESAEYRDRFGEGLPR